MSTNDFRLISDPHAPPRHPDANSVNGGNNSDYYRPQNTSFPDSDPEKSGSGAGTTPSSKRNNQNLYYYDGGSGNKKQRQNGGESTAAAAEYRKDREEWSETAIACLLEAYTEKFNELNRGNLRGRDWEDVAEAVSERGGVGSNSNSKKSVEQCKNKIDNLKKRYKVEMQRVFNGGGSNWHWFKQVELIINGSTGRTGAGAGAGGGESDVGGGAGGGGVGGNGSLVVVRQAKRYTPGNVPVVSNLKSKSMPILKWRRVVFKISGAALAGNCQNIDPKVAVQIAREVATACHLGLEVAIVVGGRNFFCGDSWITATGLERPTAYQIGMMATVMNSILLQSALEKLGVQARVQSAFAVPESAEPYSRQRAIRHLEKGRVVIFGGVGSGAGNPLFTTDTTAALRASENALIKGTNVNGVYDDHSSNSNVILDHLSFREVVSRVVPSLDMMAITYCEENGIPVFNLLEPGNISRALCGEPIGTLIDKSGRIS